MIFKVSLKIQASSVMSQMIDIPVGNSHELIGNQYSIAEPLVTAVASFGASRRHLVYYISRICSVMFVIV